MPSMRCTCGHVFSTGAIPTPNGFWVISESDFCKLGENVDRMTLDRLIFGGGLMYRCTECGEIIIQWRKDMPWEFYSPSPPKPESEESRDRKGDRPPY
jgi:hypothetical protein